MEYVAGKIISNSWGYDQTNIDFYMILKRSGNFVTIQRMSQVDDHDHARMTGSTVPKAINPKAKSFRRKVHCNREGREIGLAVHSYGWASLWDGQPEHYSSYA